MFKLLIITIFLTGTIFAQYTVDLCTGGTVSASTSYFAATNAFDDNTSTHWSSDGSSTFGTQIGNGYPEWLKYDFGAGNSKTINQYKILTDTENDWIPDDWEFQGSNDNSNWTTLDTKADQFLSEDTWFTYNSFTNTNAYRYYRIYITDSGNSESWTNDYWVDIAEMEMMESSEPMPVELTTFTAFVEENSVQLNWETATEVNNYGFEIHRSTQNESISEGEIEIKSWEKVGFVEGSGNSNSPKQYSYSEKNINISGKCYYRLKQIDIDGQYEYSPEVEINIDVPTKFELNQNYPNPFNPTTVIHYSIPKASKVNIVVYNSIGEAVRTLENIHKEAGKFNISFDASSLPSGIYFYNLQAGEFTQTRKMMLIK